MIKLNKKLDILPITNDYIFKKIFTKEGNESILKDLLIAILDIQIEKIKVQAEVSLEKAIKENKLGRLDIVAELNDKAIINIEMQVVNQKNIIDRSLYYWSGLHYSNLLQGNKYEKAKRTISINIVKFEIFEEGPYHEVAVLKRNFNNKILTEKMEMHFIQIPKFIKEKARMNTKLDEWMYFISQIDEEGVKEVMEKNEAIKKANEEYKYLIGDEAERRIAFLREKAIKDEISNIEGAREEGLEEGKKKKQIEIAKKLLKRGMKIEEISEITELTKEELIKINKKVTG